MRFIVSYDVVDDKRRTKLAKRLLNFGSRVQYSVFECNLTSEQLRQLKKQTLACIKKEEDSLRIYRLCEECSKRMQAYGESKRPELDEDEPNII